MAKRYTKILCEEVPEWGPECWVFYPEGGNYIDDELFRMPGGSIISDARAQKALDALNGELDGMA